MLRDNQGYKIQVFAPSEGVTLTTTYTPDEDAVVCIATDVTITLDSIAVEYLAGSVIGLSEDVTYTFSAETSAHRM